MISSTFDCNNDYKCINDSFRLWLYPVDAWIFIAVLYTIYPPLIVNIKAEVEFSLQNYTLRQISHQHVTNMAAFWGLTNPKPCTSMREHIFYVCIYCLTMKPTSILLSRQILWILHQHIHIHQLANVMDSCIFVFCLGALELSRLSAKTNTRVIPNSFSTITKYLTSVKKGNKVHKYTLLIHLDVMNNFDEDQ